MTFGHSVRFDYDLERDGYVHRLWLHCITTPTGPQLAGPGITKREGSELGPPLYEMRPDGKLGLRDEERSEIRAFLARQT